jgi:hypothetical protein
VGGLASAGVLGFAFGVAVGLNDTLFAALAMEAAAPELAASTFALLMAVTNLSVVGDALFARGVTLTGGYALPFASAALLTLAALPAAWPLGRPGPEAGAKSDAG